MVRVNIFGDICPAYLNVGQYSIGAGIQNLMCNAINIGNFECPVTNCDEKRPLQAKNLKISPKQDWHVLNDFNGFSLANNHVCDFGNKGVIDTIEFLKKSGKGLFGAGRTREEAIQPLCFDIDGMKIGFVGATRYSNIQKGGMGTVNENDKFLFYVINQLKESGYFVIAYLHWGYEYVRLPAPRERALARKFLNAGVDFVVGSHPHVFQGYEIYKDKSIFYSLGNFIFSREVFEGLSAKENDDRLWNSFFVELRIRQNGDYDVIPHFYTIGKTEVELLADDSLVLGELTRISQPLVQNYYSYWKQYYRQAVETCRQNAKVRKKFQKIGSCHFVDKCKILFDFNTQDLRNRLANLVPWFFKA